MKKASKSDVEVTVKLDDTGKATFTIHDGAAIDEIEVDIGRGRKKVEQLIDTWNNE